MQTTNSNILDEKFALVRGYFGFSVVLLNDSVQDWVQEILTTGTYEDMRCLKKIMEAAHANN